MGYTWLEEAGLIAGTPEWEERERSSCMEEPGRAGSLAGSMKGDPYV